MQTLPRLFFPLRWLTIAALFAGFSCSRTLLSMALMCFALNELRYGSLATRLRSWWQQPYAVVFTFLFWLPALTFFWSSDAVAWGNQMLILIPLLLVPLLTALPPPLHPHETNGMALAFVVVITAGTLYSTGAYLQAAERYHAVYDKAKIFLTPASGDYVRFSWAVCIALLLGLHLLRQTTGWRPLHQWLLGTTLLWLVLYLHLLGSKTGMLGSYGILAGNAVALLKMRQRRLGWLLLLVLVLAPVVAYYLFPTLQLRLRYISWDFEHYIQGRYIEGLSDGNRILSARAALELLRENWLAGLGFGDIFSAMQQWYTVNAPWMPRAEMLYPSNQWLQYAVGAGVAGVLLVTVVVLWPFFRKGWPVNYYVFHALCVFTMLYENSLGQQYGVFLYGFFIWYFAATLQRTDSTTAA